MENHDYEDITTCTMCTIYDEIQAERQRADSIYGEKRNLAVTEWENLILSELEEAMYGFTLSRDPPHDYRTEMIQVVSLVIAAIQSWDRQNA